LASREKTIRALKRSLRQAHPDWSDEKITSSAFAVYNSKNKKVKSKEVDSKETLHSAFAGLDWKELVEAQTFYSKGYAATTDYDRVGDILTLDCLEDAANQLNQLSNIDADEVSYRHDRSDPKPIAIATHDSEIEVLADEDQYGLKVTSNHIKTHEKYDEYAYDVMNGAVKGYSIEYQPVDVLEDTRVFENGDLVSGHRIIDKIALRGYGYASGRFIANPNARLIEYGYKEIKSLKEKEKVEVIKVKEDVVMEQTETKEVPVVESAPAQEQIVVKEAPVVAKEQPIDVKEQIAILVKEVLNDKQFAKEVASVEVKEKVLTKEGDDKLTSERIEIKEFKEMLSDKTLDVDVKFKEAGLIAEKLGMIKHNGQDSLILKESSVKETGLSFKQFRTNGSKLEFKGLGITTNQNSDTDYLLSGAELRDVFDPVIYDALNQSTTTWALLRKDDFSNKGNNQVQFILETGANATAGFYTGNSVSTGQSTILKMQTKFKKVQVGVQVDGDMIAAARGGPVGDVFGLHVRLATKTLLNTINSALFANTGLETAAGIIGFQYIADSAGNTSLYNLTRSTTNKLSPASAGDTYINGSSQRISVDNMRKAIEQAVKEGADINNLVFITHPTQERLFKGIYDASQRLMPTSSRFGFAGRPEFDSVPIFADKDCGNDDWFLVDLDSHRVAIWVPPTLEMLGKSADSVEGFIKCYLATYNVMPRRLVMIYGCATS